MKKNPGRKERRSQEHMQRKKKGNSNCKATHKMRTHDGMIKSKKFIKTLDKGIIST